MDPRKSNWKFENILNLLGGYILSFGLNVFGISLGILLAILWNKDPYYPYITDELDNTGVTLGWGINKITVNTEVMYKLFK